MSRSASRSSRSTMILASASVGIGWRVRAQREMSAHGFSQQGPDSLREMRFTGFNDVVRHRSERQLARKDLRNESPFAVGCPPALLFPFRHNVSQNSALTPPAGETANEATTNRLENLEIGN